MSDAIIEQAIAIRLTQIYPRANTMISELIACLHAEGFKVLAWAMGNEELMRQVVKVGAGGMTVNFPDKLIAYLTHHQYQREGRMCLLNLD